MKINEMFNENVYSRSVKVVPGVGGVDPREVVLAASLASAPRLLDDEVFDEYNLEFLA